MALINAERIIVGRNDVVIYEWANLTDGDTATPVQVPAKSDRTIEVSGDFGSGGDIRPQGTLDPDAVSARFNDMRDPQGNVISIIAQDAEAILENTVWIRPNVNAGTSVDVTVRILMN